MHVAGVIVRTRPEFIEPVSAAVRRLEGVAVHAATPEGRLIVTIESGEPDQTAERLLDLQLLPQVLSAALVYEHAESDVNQRGEAP